MKDNTKQAIISARMNEAFQRWKEERKREGKPASAEEFGKLLNPPASRGSIENYLKGEQTPKPDRLEDIRKHLGVPEDYFNTDNATHDELYQHSSLYQTELGKKHVKFAKLIGLDLDLIRALSKVVDFDKLFPLYSPIEHTTKSENKDHIIFDREVFFENAESIDDDLRFLQVERDGERKTLHRCDLAFLKEVQDQVVDYVEYLLYKRAKEMEEETKRFNMDFTKVIVDGEPVTDPEVWYKVINGKIVGHSVGISVKDLTPDFIREHDRFAKYCYIFRDDPDPDWSSIYDEEVNEATQENIDTFLEGDVNLPGGGVATVKEGK